MTAAVIFSCLLYLNIHHVNILRLRADSGKDPRNPSRGFYIQIDSGHPERLQEYHQELRLCLLAYDIYDFRDRPIEDEKLQELEIFLEEAEKQNMKCIFRAAYGFQREECNDADSWELLCTHVRQIAPILNRHQKEIYCLQAGFLGPWGEWHSSKYLEGPDAADYRRELTSLLLKETVPEISIDLRRPRFLRELGFSDPRLGFHNDGLLASSTDLGTYDDPAYDRSRELQWMQENLSCSHNGGEMPAVNAFSEPENAMKELSSMHLSYLNRFYNQEVLEDWDKKLLNGQNALSCLSRHLGYRFHVSSLELPARPRRGIWGLGQTVALTLKNEGFAPIDSRYRLEVILEDLEGLPILYGSLEDLPKSGRELAVRIPVSDLYELKAQRIGLRICEKEDPIKLPQNCVELVNEDLRWEKGINYILDLSDLLYP